MSEGGTDWIKPGAEAVVYQLTSMSLPRIRAVGHVTTVDDDTFQVSGVSDSFERSTTLSVVPKGRIALGRSAVTAYGSPEARELFAEHDRWNKRRQARDAVSEWLRRDTEENRLAAIEALQQVED